MGKMVDYLTQEWVEARRGATKARQAPTFLEANPDGTGSLDEPRASLGTHPGAGLALTERVEEESPDRGAEILKSDAFRLGCLISQCVALCECEYLLGSSPNVIRDLCRSACVASIPYLKVLDYSMKHARYEDGLTPSSARAVAEKYGGTWWKVSARAAGADYFYKNDPLLVKLPLWCIATLSGDPDLAFELASHYQVDVSKQDSIVSVREGLLRCALARDADGEALLAGRLEPGYPTDFPPQLIEIPLGVIRRDPVMILEAVRKISTKFKGKWDVKKHRAWYDKRQPTNPARKHPNGTWEQCLARTKDTLVSRGWVFSWWAIAWLELARWRGLGEVFEPSHRKAFSEWVPIAVIDPGHTP